MTKLKDHTIDFILNHDFPRYEDFKYDKSNDRYYRGGLLVHNIIRRNSETLDSLVEQGILLKYNTSNYFTWAVNLGIKAEHLQSPLRKCHRTGLASIGFTLPMSAKVEKMNYSEWGVYEDILPNRMRFVDLYLGPDNLWLSDIPFIIKDYSLDSFVETYSLKNNDCIRNEVASYLSDEQYTALLNWAVYNSR